MRKYKSYKQPAELNNIEDTTNSDHHFQAAQILLLRFISDTIENILNLTTTKAKSYWINGHNTEYIMKHLLSKTNFNFLFNWFNKQYKMNRNYYKESNAQIWINYFEDYFIAHDYNS
eukprot:101369_1